MTSSWKPFESWRLNAASSNPHSLSWYTAYNATKHNRATALNEASLENLIYAVTGLLVVLSAQYHTNDFGPITYMIRPERPSAEFEIGIGGYFSVKFPDNVPLAERYEFTWPYIENDPQPFEKFNYTNV